MNATEAKKMAAAHKRLKDEELKNKIQTVEKSNVALLYKHLHDKIESAVNEGRMVTDKVTFPQDRFDNNIIQEVHNMLKGEGFSLNKTEQNAYKQIEFTVSWA